MTAARAAFTALCGTLLLAALGSVTGCTQHRGATPALSSPPRVLVVAPVLNLSGNQDFDALKVTDLIASEFSSFPDVAVIPVNLTLAELERRGKEAVESPEDAVALARSLGADATIVTAITEYEPYTPVVGLIMQWYSARSEPGSAGRTANSALSGDGELSDQNQPAPRLQIQRVFNAADEKILDQIRAFADERDGQAGPYGWRKYVRSQELYLRYCGWSAIRTMLKLDRSDRTAVKPNEAES